MKKESDSKVKDELDYDNHIVEYDKQYIDNSNAQAKSVTDWFFFNLN